MRQAATGSQTDSAYVVRSLRVGHAECRGPELFWMSDWETFYPLCFQSVLIQGAGITALVNTGPPRDLDVINGFWGAGGGERSRMHRAPEEDLVAALGRCGVEPSDVTHVLLTPLELYTTGLLTEFTNATICMSKQGWVHHQTTHDHPHDSRWRSFTRETLVSLVTDGWDRVRLLEDEDEIAPGLRTWWTGVHHRASIAVEVETSVGIVSITDACFYYENVEDNRLLGLNESMAEFETAMRRLRATATHIVPLTDPKVFDRYPGGVIAPSETG